MGARKQRFIEKIKVIINALRDEAKTPRTIVTCSNCNSTSVSFESGKKIEESTTTIIYHSTYYCRKCGFECKNTQKWQKGVPR